MAPEIAADEPTQVVRVPGSGGPALAFAETEAGRQALSRAAAKAAAAEDLSGEILAERYRLIRQIGRGGMGAVYLAEHILIGKQVAVKVMGYEHSRRPQDIERFLHEARAASRIRHENIVDITDFGYTDDGLGFLVMEYLEGEDLAVTMAREGRFGWERAVAIARQICAALAGAHAAGIVHRDMKLENCFRITRGDNPDFIKVLDFGIAKVVDDAPPDPDAPAMTSSALVGTPEYVSPELVKGHKADARADIYAVGVILYKMLTGEVPLRGDSYMATLTKHLLEKPVPPRRRCPGAPIPEALEAVVMRALEKEPERRYQTVQELSAALAGPEQPIGRRRGLAPALALVGLLAAAGVGVWWWTGQGEVEGEGEGVGAAARDRSAAAAADGSAGPGEAAAATGEAAAASATGESTTAAATDEAASTGEAASATGEADEATSTGDGAGEPTAAEPLSKQEIARGVAAIQGAVRGCSKYALPGMTVTVRIKVSGDTGKVVSADPLGSHAGSTLGECVARAARRAKFPGKAVDSTFTRTFKM